MKKTVESNLPLVSIIMTTYNRSKLLVRAVDSVLNQSYKNIDLIIVDDGSTDDTSEVLKKYTDSRIRVFKHEVNRGATSAKNTGLKQITGEWFTTFDSDDEMVPEAIETLMNIPLYFDTEVTSVTANGWEPISNTFTGKGLDKDCYLNGNEIMLRCTGDFWGIVKTDLLHNESFNEKLIGCESTLWYKLGERAKGYYVHKALIIIHVEGNDRITTSKISIEKKILHYENIINEELYLKITQKSDPEEYLNICKHGLLIMRLKKNKELAPRYYELLKSSQNSLMYYLIYKFDFTITVYKVYAKLMPWLRKLKTG
jgi:GalNAc5-diNAcBac-PP-undecaprenol beta-1,3-glucosyltransferase